MDSRQDFFDVGNMPADILYDWFCISFRGSRVGGDHSAVAWDAAHMFAIFDFSQK